MVAGQTKFRDVRRREGLWTQFHKNTCSRYETRLHAGIDGLEKNKQGTLALKQDKPLNWPKFEMQKVFSRNRVFPRLAGTFVEVL